LKYLVVIALLALLLVLLYRKLRPYLISLQQIINFIRQFPETKVSNSKPQGSAEKLVQCVGCGTWIPASRAIASRADAVYCSTECLKGKKRTPQAG